MTPFEFKKILNLPTPWQEVNTTWSQEAGIKLFVKRDDLIHPLISGNKWRKLKGILENSGPFDVIHTFGGAYSNHLIATAALANKLGVSSVGIIRGEEPKYKSTVLELCEFYGMELQFVDREAYRQLKTKSGVVGTNLYIPEGGSSSAGTIGCEDIINEQRIDLDHIYVASGTATTLAGILKANQGRSLVHGVSALKGGDFLENEVKALGVDADFDLILDMHEGGYARTTPSLMKFVEEFYNETEILLDPIYTSKAALAIKRSAENGDYRSGSRIGLVHTGGLTGWYGKWTELIPFIN